MCARKNSFPEWDMTHLYMGMTYCYEGHDSRGLHMCVHTFVDVRHSSFL